MQLSKLKFVLAAAASLFVLSAGSRSRAAETYTVDNVHSSVHFKIHHKGAGYVWGRFNEIGGQFVVDEKKPANSSIELTVQTGSVDTGFAQRDQHVMSPDFFNAKQFPTISFKSTKVKKTGQQTAEVTGDLTIAGKTRPVTAKVRHTGSEGDLAGFETSFKIKRSDWGLKFMLGPVGDEVELFVNVEGGKKK